jgi:hypothetical protein
MSSRILSLFREGREEREEREEREGLRENFPSK